MATASLSARRDAGGGLLLVALDVEPELARGYTAPGQYVEVTTPAGRGYFVLASEVGAAPWEFLVKNAGEAADALVSLPLGHPVNVQGPLGEGFPVSVSPSRPVVVAVVGSALAVARPVIARRLGEGLASTTFLFLGLRTPAHLPLPAEIEAWAGEGVKVVLCLSKSELNHHPEVLPMGKRVASYVQHAVASAVEAGEVPPGALVVAAGPDAMLQDMRRFALTRGTESPVDVVTNV